MKSILVLTVLIIISHAGLAQDEQIKLSDKTTLAFRGEYDSDENGMIIPMTAGTGMTSGSKTTGLPTNQDYKISSNALWRIESRNFSSKDPIFFREGKNVKSDTFVTTSPATSF